MAKTSRGVDLLAQGFKAILDESLADIRTDIKAIKRELYTISGL